MASYNLGVRLVRNAGNDRSGTVMAAEVQTTSQLSGKILIAYFSWGGNTRGIAQEIHKITGADLFEIKPVDPYSTDYNTVLMEAQEDQHRQARPELSDHVGNMEDYDAILLGYPNWWGDWPMIMYTFFEDNVDAFAGKTLIPFSTHEGSGLSGFDRKLESACPNGMILEGLAIRGNDCQNKQDSVQDAVNDWLAGLGY